MNSTSYILNTVVNGYHLITVSRGDFKLHDHVYSWWVTHIVVPHMK